MLAASLSILFLHINYYVIITSHPQLAEEFLRHFIHFNLNVLAEFDSFVVVIIVDSVSYGSTWKIVDQSSGSMQNSQFILQKICRWRLSEVSIKS